MLIALQSFRGERPAVDARLLGYTEATLAENVKLWTGAPQPWRGPLIEFSAGVSEDVVSIYRYSDPTGNITWLTWETDVDVVKSQVAGLDELYWTGDGAPRIGNEDSIEGGTPYYAFDLGVPAPATAVTLEATDPAETPAEGTVLSITPYLEIGGTIGDGSTQVTANRSPFSVEATLDVDGLMRFSITFYMDFSQRKAYTSAVNVRVEMDPSTGAQHSGTEIFSKSVTLSLPKNTGGRNTWSTADYPAGDYDFEYAAPLGSHVFRLWTEHGFKSTDDGGNPDNRTQFAAVQAASGRLLIDLGTTDHGLEPDDEIQLAGVVGTGNLENLNLNPVKIIGFQPDGQTAIVEAGGINGTYDDDPPATWRQVFDPVDQQPRAYVITYVVTLEDHDMESAPSPVSSFLNAADGESTTLSNFPAPPDDGRNYTKVFIYRLSVGNAGEEFLFVDELDVATFDFDNDTYTDSTRGVDLGRVLPSQYTSPSGVLVRWDMPPATMTGLIDLPNGMQAAFDGNELLLCEPYQPHAWPIAYRRAMKSSIVAIAAFGASIAVTTVGRPVIVTGIHPDSMSEEYVEADYPNLSKRGTVDVGYAVIYPSLRGAVILSQGSAQIITETLFTDDQWRALNPASFIGAKYGNRYMWSYLPEHAEDDPLNRKALVIDVKNPNATLTRLTFGPTELWSDPDTGELYVLTSYGAPTPTLGVYRWEGDPNTIFGRMRWRSKEYVYSVPTFAGVAKIDADLYPVTVTLYMDGEPYDTIVAPSEQPQRVDTTLGKGRKWQLEFTSDVAVEGAYCASNVRELTAYTGGA